MEVFVTLLNSYFALLYFIDGLKSATSNVNLSMYSILKPSEVTMSPSVTVTSKSFTQNSGEALW